MRKEIGRMEYKEDKDLYPCDTADEDGVHRCPYEDTYTGYESEMCRVCCGLGVDD